MAGRLGRNAQLPNTQIHESFARRLPLPMPEVVDIREVFPYNQRTIKDERGLEVTSLSLVPKDTEGL